MPDSRSKADKLRAMFHHPRTSHHEREAAKLALERMNEPLVKPSYRPSSPPPPPPPRRGGFDFDYVIFDDFIRQTQRTSNAFSQAQRVWEEALRRTEAERQRRQRETARAAEEARRQRAEEVRRQGLPKCPGCHHAESAHVSFRCYTCGHTPKDTDVRRAQRCGWMWADSRGGEWVRAVTNWRTGPDVP